MSKTPASTSTPEQRLTPENVVAAARELLGVRWVHQSRVPEVGVDCIGLVLWALQQNDWQPRDARTATANYELQARDDLLLRLMKKEGHKVPQRDGSLSRVQLADCLLFRWPNQQHAQHLGMVSRIDDDGTIYFLHAHRAAGKVVENGLRANWLDRLVAVYRLKDFD